MKPIKMKKERTKVVDEGLLAAVHDEQTLPPPSKKFGGQSEHRYSAGLYPL